MRHEHSTPSVAEVSLEGAIVMHVLVGVAIAALASYIVQRAVWLTLLRRGFGSIALVIALDVALILVGWFLRKREKYVGIGIAAYAAAYLTIHLAGTVLAFVARLTF